MAATPIVKTPAISAARATLIRIAEPPDLRSQNGFARTASASSATATPAITGRVPKAEISTKPVANTPTMLPSVAAAWI